MPPISRASSRKVPFAMRMMNRLPYRRQGFTLIEMNAVILVLAMAAALVVPNIVSIWRSRSLHDLEAAILRLPVEAGNEARRIREPVRIRVEGDALVLERVPDGSDPEEIKRVRLGDRIRVESARRGGEEMDPESWEWQVYPDGSSDSGGIEFSEGMSIQSMVLTADGQARWVSGELPESAEDRWPAGEIERRG